MEIDTTAKEDIIVWFQRLEIVESPKEVMELMLSHTLVIMK